MLNRRLIINFVLATLFISSVPAQGNFFYENKKNFYQKAADTVLGLVVLAGIAYFLYKDFNRRNNNGDFFRILNGNYGNGNYGNRNPRPNQAVHTRFKVLVDPVGAPSLKNKLLEKNDVNNNEKLESKECVSCWEDKNPKEFHKMSCCGMEFCKDCMINVIEPAIREKDVSQLRCPNSNCTFNNTNNGKTERNRIQRNDLENLLDEQNLKIVDNLIERGDDSKLDNFRQCPTPDCNGYLIMGKDVQGNNIVERVTCPQCHRNYCTDCLKDHSYETTCDEVRIEAERVANISGDEQERLNRELLNRNFRHCPGCRRPIEKIIGCRAINCPCGTEFCWDCGQRTHNHTLNHNCPNARPGNEFDIFDNMFNGRDNINRQDNLLKYR